MPKNLKRTGAAALDLEKVEELASKGLTLEQIAHATGMNARTLYTKRKRHEEVRNAIDRGAAKGIEVIANELFTAAKNGNITAQIFYLKARGGWRDHGPIVEVNTVPQQHNTHVNIDLDVLMGRVNLLRDAIKVLRDLGVPVAQELEEIELSNVDFKALPAPGDREDPE